MSDEVEIPQEQARKAVEVCRLLVDYHGSARLAQKDSPVGIAREVLHDLDALCAPKDPAEEAGRKAVEAIWRSMPDGTLDFTQEWTRIAIREVRAVLAEHFKEDEEKKEAVKALVKVPCMYVDLGNRDNCEFCRKKDTVRRLFHLDDK